MLSRNMIRITNMNKIQMRNFYENREPIFNKFRLLQRQLNDIGNDIVPKKLKNKCNELSMVQLFDDFKRVQRDNQHQIKKNFN